MFTLPVIVAIALTVEEDGTPSMNICMGKTEVNFLNFNRGFVCKSKNWLENVLCNIILYTYIITSCNIIEVFFMWSTYQHIKESTESAKALIGRQHYQKRKKYDYIYLNVCDSFMKYSLLGRHSLMTDLRGLFQFGTAGHCLALLGWHCSIGTAWLALLGWHCLVGTARLALFG